MLNKNKIINYKDVEAPKKRDISMILSSVVFNDYCSVIDVLILVTFINQCLWKS